jgi:hypothetical protein
MRRVLIAAALALGASGCGPPSPGPRVQGVLDLYAPDLRLSAWISSAAHKRYKLEVAPYTGYQDRTFRGIEGVSVLTIRLDEPAGDAPNERNSDWARIDSVTMTTPDAASSAQVEARLRASLGTPEVSCYFTTGVRARWRRLYWAGEQGRGALLLVSRGPLLEDLKKPVTGPLAPPPAGSAWVTFGAPAPDRKSVNHDVCN